MMAKKDRIPSKHAASFAPRYESEGSGISDRIDSTEGSAALMRKWVDLNSASRDGFAVPIQIVPLSKLSSFERKNLVFRLTSELERIRLLQKKVELQKTKLSNAVTVSSSSDILSCNNTQHKGLQVGNVKKSSGLGSRPGKKGRGWNRGIKGRFESANQNTPPLNPHARLLKQCESLLKQLMSQEYAWVFNTPVDPVKLNIPDYFNVIKNPMDLGTIKSNITLGKYSSPLDFLADVRLTFTNAKAYNQPGSDVHFMADTMSQFFELRWKAMEKKHLVNSSQTRPEKSGIHNESKIAKPMAPSKKRKLSPAQHKVKQEPIKQKMTDEEKHKLGSELEDLLGDLPDSIVEFLRAQSSNGGDGGEDEIEIDIDDLSDDTLFTLQKLLNDHLQEKQKNHAKSEACEMELPNESGLSNSSLQVDKEDNEDVDIGGNEAPVTSYPPVEIDKDAVGGVDEYTEAGPESRTTSDKESECSKGSLKQAQDDASVTADSIKNAGVGKMVDGHPSVSELDQHEQSLVLKPYASDSDSNEDGESPQAERQVSPDKQYNRAAVLITRFADTILKAQEKTLSQDDKGDPEKLRREREELEMHKKREKARLQAEVKAAEDARKRAEAEAAAELKKRREREREAAREALLKIEKTVEINENYRFLEDLEMLRTAPPEQLPISLDETSPDQSQDGFGNFNFGGSNPLEKLGLYMKVDDDEEDGEPPGMPNVMDDVEEGEID